MSIITDARCTQYHREGHPERPARIQETTALLKQQKGLELSWIQPEPAPREAVQRAHSADLIRNVMESREDFDGDTPWHPGIHEHTLRAAGGALRALREAGQGRRAFSLLRPPGHHATRSQAMGFCYFNSIAIAALAARHEGFKRVAVFDFDVHHGNGTEDILLNQEGMMFISVHQSPCYPGTGLTHRGPQSRNFTVRPSTPRLDYRKILEGAIAELQQWKPDIVGVSAGFDAYARDPLAQGTLEREDFHWLGERMTGLGVPVFSVLEGGYSSDLPELILQYLRGIAGA
ncbi:MAG: histone deacetylase [Verrucomicrobia bacterium]|nr:histone deacetylase [Verrucomicrobiota bacterium]